MGLRRKFRYEVRAEGWGDALHTSEFHARKAADKALAEGRSVQIRRVLTFGRRSAVASWLALDA